MPNLIHKSYKSSNYIEYKEELYRRGFRRLGEGSFREVYRRKNVVVKIPHNDSGFDDNIVEAFAYLRYRKGADSNLFVFAPCRLLPNGCLLMVYVEPLFYPNKPLWANYIDGGQVGTYNGRIVAYDSANELSELRLWALHWAGVTS
jgi:hypothetical protein